MQLHFAEFQDHAPVLPIQLGAHWRDIARQYSQMGAGGRLMASFIFRAPLIAFSISRAGGDLSHAQARPPSLPRAQFQYVS